MTTLIIDCANQKVFADTCTTTSQRISYDKTVLGYLLTDREKTELHEHRVVRERNNKIHKVGDTVIVGCGDKRLIDRFVENYNTDSECDIRQNDGDARIYVVSKREIGLLVDTYTPKTVKKKWYFRKQKVWDIKSEVKTQGFITDGSGGDYAAGALTAGASGVDAIIAASQLDPSTNNKVDTCCVD